MPNVLPELPKESGPFIKRPDVQIIAPGIIVMIFGALAIKCVGGSNEAAALFGLGLGAYTSICQGFFRSLLK